METPIWAFDKGVGVELGLKMEDESNDQVEELQICWPQLACVKLTEWNRMQLNVRKIFAEFGLVKPP